MSTEKWVELYNISESLYCILETNTVQYINDTSILKVIKNVSDRRKNIKLRRKTNHKETFWYTKQFRFYHFILKLVEDFKQKSLEAVLFVFYNDI